MGMQVLLIGTLLAGSLLAASPEYQRASELYHRTEYKQAISVLDKVRGPDADSLLLLGRAYFGAGDYGNATEVLGRAAKDALERLHGSQGVFARTWPAGAMGLGVMLMLLAFLLSYYIT